MWTEINQRLRQKVPALHAALKRRAFAWRQSPAPLIPCLKRVRGEFYWVHPRLLTEDTTDHEPHIARWILDHLPRGGVFFDVGAHYGWLSLNAARHVGRRGRVIAFEPSPVLIEILRYHQSRNRVPQMSVVAAAVSDHDASQATLYLINGGLSSRNSLTSGGPGAAEVATVTLDAFQHLSPDVIKIDVEGAEGMVLRGAARILQESRPVLVLSTHPYLMPAGDSTEAILANLATYGYQVKDSRVEQFEGFEAGDYLLA